MARSGRRKYSSFLDFALYLIAISAALVATREHWLDFFEYIGPKGDFRQDDFPNRFYRLKWFVYFFSIHVLCLSFAYLILGIMRSRRESRKIADQPGLIACMVTVAISAIQMANLATSITIRMIYFPDHEAGLFMRIRDLYMRTDELPWVPSIIGCGIISAWMVHWLNHGWIRPNTLNDWFEILLGLYWTLTIPVSWA